MLEFFRNIRQNLIRENRFSKYRLYAIGEIILVVIGILIAIGINSIYKASQNEVKAILTQMHQDLKTDIIDAKRIHNTYIGKDVLFQKIMNDSITFEMYKENPYPLPITVNYVSFIYKTSGYNRFIDNLENITEKYNYLLPHLNNLCIEMQNDIDDYNTNIKNTLMIDGREDLKTNPKLTDFIYGRRQDEVMEYFFKDPFLKNKSEKYMNDLSNISQAANAYRIESIILSKKIDSLLGRTAIVYAEPLVLFTKKEAINDFLGDYRDKADVLGVTASISIENGQLVLKNSNFLEAILYWHEGVYYFIKEASSIFRLYKNKKDQHIAEIKDFRTNSKFIKTNNL